MPALILKILVGIGRSMWLLPWIFFSDSCFCFMAKAQFLSSGHTIRIFIEEKHCTLGNFFCISALGWGEFRNLGRLANECFLGYFTCPFRIGKCVLHISRYAEFWHCLIKGSERYHKQYTSITILESHSSVCICIPKQYSDVIGIWHAKKKYNNITHDRAKNILKH